jgi:hypothetical protein
MTTKEMTVSSATPPPTAPPIMAFFGESEEELLRGAALLVFGLSGMGREVTLTCHSDSMNYFVVQ